MRAEIIAVGTELTTGAKLDTNSQWLSVELAAVGIPVCYHSTVADALDANLLVVQTAIQRADIVIITGGLGPTLDDLTREVLAAVMGSPLVLHEPSLREIEELFTRRKRIMPERNKLQAMFPAGSEPIANPRGTAPGVWIELPRQSLIPCRIAAMPGVPSEMKPMFLNSVLPRLIDACGTGRIIRSARVNCYGLGESQCDEMLGDLTARGRDPEVGITVHEGTITLRIEAQGTTIEECETKIAEAKLIASQRLGDHVFGIEDEDLETVVLRKLKQRNLTLATAESATGGLLAAGLTRSQKGDDHASAKQESPFQYGLIGTESRLRAEVSHLHESDMLDQEVLANALRSRYTTDFLILIGDITWMPTPDSQPPIPKVPILLVGKGVVATHEVLGLSDPSILKSRASKTALDLLRRHLINN